MNKIKKYLLSFSPAILPIAIIGTYSVFLYYEITDMQKGVSLRTSEIISIIYFTLLILFAMFELYELGFRGKTYIYTK
jgi:hypothetical protein